MSRGAKPLVLGPFLGLSTSLDSRSINYTRSPRMQNVRIESGALEVRNGYRNLDGIPSGFSAAYGLEHLEGYSSSDGGVTYAFADEYVSIETRSGNTRPYSVNPATGVRTEIKNGTTSLGLSAGEWRGVPFREKSYWFDANGNVARHLIGDNTSWVALSQPSAPSAPSVTFGATQSISSFASSSLGSLTGLASSSSLPDNYHWKVNHSAGTGTGGFTIDLGTGALQDLQFQDSFAISIFLDAASRFNISNLVITFINNDSSPQTFTPSLLDTTMSYNGSAATMSCWLYFDGKLRDEILGLKKVRAATTAALAACTYANGTAGVGATLTATSNGAIAAVDGVTLVAADRLLVKNQVAGLQNGIYVVTQVGDASHPFILTRATDADEPKDFATMLAVYPTAGSTLTNKVYDCGATTVTLGTTALTFTVESTPDTRGRHFWSNVRKIAFSYTVNAGGGAAENYLRVGIPALNRIDTMYGWSSTAQGLKFGVSYVNSASGTESDIASVTVPRAHFDSERTTPNDPTHNNSTPSLVTLNAVAPTEAGVDTLRFYYSATDGAWHKLGEQASSTLTFGVQVSDAEALLLASLEPYSFAKGTVLCAASFNGSMVWAYRGGFQNIKFSRVGDAEKQASVSDDPTLGDTSFGATFSLADDFADDAVAAHQAGDAMIYLGSAGVYAHSGSYPTGMSAIHKLPGSKGIASPRSSSRWTDDMGNPGVAYLTNSGELYFAIVSQAFDGQNGYRLIEVSEQIRGWIDNYLRAGQSLSDYSTARISVDEKANALWVVMGKRAVILRRRSEVDQARQWEPYEYATDSGGTIKYLAFHSRHGLRWIRSTGHFDEAEISSADGLPIRGLNRDGGNAMPSIFWTSKTFSGMANYRLDLVNIIRDDLADRPTLTGASTRQTSSVQPLAGLHKARFGALQQGSEHQFTVTMAEASSPVRRITIQPSGPIGKRNLQ